VHFDKIPLTGKVDKIEVIDSIGRRVRVVDYKTSSAKTANEVLGLTKNSDKNLLYQAYFYKLLGDADPGFSWKITEIEFDFLTPDKTCKFAKVRLPIDPEIYKDFKETLKTAYNNILNMKFEKTSDAKRCQGFFGSCDYADFC
jgi:hypothetical protein